mgnify:CR=1 FL=1
MKINIPSSIGELFDKISILEIKKKKIIDKNKLIEINKELKLLIGIVKKNKLKSEKLTIHLKNLKKVNAKLWNVEDKLRKYEKNKSFDNDFIKKARSVYIMNDKRAMLKYKINKITKSKITEIKSYQDY